jgi:hypothetical protein
MFITLVCIYYTDKVKNCGVDGPHANVTEGYSLKGCDAVSVQSKSA